MQQMNIEQHAADLLARCPSHSLSLYQLHAMLVHEAGGPTGTYQELHLRLKQRSAQFSVVCRARPWGDGELWTGAVREAYSRALDQAGVDTSPLVTLVAASDRQEDVVIAMRTTLQLLGNDLTDDPVAREDLLYVLGS
jgi:hypothetical protein